MKRKMYWGVALLILLLGTAAVFVIQHEVAENSELNDQLEGAAELANQIEQGKTAENNPSPDPMVSTEEEIPLQESSDLDDLNAGKTDSSSEKVVLSEAEIDAMNKANREQQLAKYIAKWGEPPSPDGSYQHTFDNHGNVLRHYEGTILISHYRFEVGFAPTISELERYKQLIAERKEVIREGDIGEMHRIDDKIQTLVNSAQREVPVPFGYGYYGPQYTEGERTNLRNQALKSFYKRMGVPHLFELHKR